MTLRSVSVEMHLRIPWSNATLIPKVDFPVPEHPPISISLGGGDDIVGGVLLVVESVGGGGGGGGRKARDERPAKASAVGHQYQHSTRQ